MHRDDKHSPRVVLLTSSASRSSSLDLTWLWLRCTAPACSLGRASGCLSLVCSWAWGPEVPGGSSAAVAAAGLWMPAVKLLLAVCGWLGLG